MKTLYLRCMGCNGTRKTRTEMQTGRMVPHDRCGCCGGAGRVSCPNPQFTEPCPVCTRVVRPNLVPLVLPAGSECPLCEDGYAEFGATTDDVLKAYAEMRYEALVILEELAVSADASQVAAQARSCVEKNAEWLRRYRAKMNLKPSASAPARRSSDPSS